MRSSSRSPLSSNRHSSTLVACAENSAKLTPLLSQVAPSGNGEPSEMRRSYGMGTLMDDGGKVRQCGRRIDIARRVPARSCVDRVMGTGGCARIHAGCAQGGASQGSRVAKRAARRYSLTKHDKNFRGAV